MHFPFSQVFGVRWFHKGAPYYQLGIWGWAGGRFGQLGSATASPQSGVLDLGWKQTCKYLQAELCCFLKELIVAKKKG